MTARTNCVSDGELQAYVDGQLAPDDRSRVESFLSSCPEERERLDTYRRQNVQLHRLFDWAAHRPLAGRHEQLVHRLARRIRLQRYMNNLQRGAAAAVVVAAVGAAGWASYQWLTPSRGPLLAFSGKGAESYVMLVGDGHADFGSDGGADAIAKRSAEMMNALAARQSAMPRRPPDLEKAGFRLIGARTMSTAIGPAVQLLYGKGDDDRVTLFLRPNASTRAIASTVVDNGDVSMIYSEFNNMAYSLVGNVDRKTILSLAALVSDTLMPAGTGAPIVPTPGKPRSKPASMQDQSPKPSAPAEGKPPSDRSEGPGTRGSVAPHARPPVIKTGLKPLR